MRYTTETQQPPVRLELKVRDGGERVVISANGVNIYSLQPDGSVYRWRYARSDREYKILTDAGFQLDDRGRVRTNEL